MVSIRMLACFGAALALQACGALGARQQPPPSQDGQVVAPLSFRVQVTSSDRAIASHLREHLDIQRFRSFPDLQAGELRRLLAEAESNARDLLAALGYFRPELQLRMEPPAAGSGDPYRVLIAAEPGEPARVSSVRIGFAGHVDEDAAAVRQREQVREAWRLREGQRFTQDDWAAAKAAGLRLLQRERYPVARIAASEATVDADTLRVDLAVTYDTGPTYRFGEVQLTGIERYDAAGIVNIARIPAGTLYSEDALLDAQQRLVTSGYFESAFLMLDPDEADPARAKVIAQLREAQYQKAVFGLGFSTDTGPRLSVNHTHNRMWPLYWRVLNQLALGSSTQSFGTRWTALPADSGWAPYAGMALERSDYGDFRARSVSLTGGRMKSVERTDRRYYLQYDASTLEGSDAPVGSSSLLANYAWTARYFDDRNNPTAGFGLGAEAGVGATLSPRQDPFLRLSARALQFLPFGSPDDTGRRNRLALRADLGAVYAAGGVNVPARLLFLTGGDTTVRGYGYQEIGTRLADDSIYGARYMATGSVEWQRPVRLFGNAAFEHALFVDAGTASDSLHRATLYTGVGTGLRWSSPVGPLQVDVAWGVHDRQARLHLRMGFQF